MNIRMQGFSPFKVEEKLKAQIDGLKLNGNVERVDRKETTNDEHRTSNIEHRITHDARCPTVVLMDYKTGNIDSHSLQLPLYAGMWQAKFNEHVERLGYYSLKEGKVTWYPGKKITMEEFIQGALQKTKELIEQIRKGQFQPEPFNDNE